MNKSPIAHVPQLPLYQSIKQVRGCKIESIVNTDGQKRNYLLTPADKEIPPFMVDQIYVHKHEPKPGGYYVVYEDGYKSFSPAKAFEEGYLLIPERISEEVTAK